ncbi:glycosyltransferase family 2 protein [Leclercia adecarboxylata]|uniref:glycosyltransferase family 2 protein n=1 Tax=Leclercia adecarboxylata TaxID=83655 RepID=UPI0013FE10CC|nr:glycosyltransferase [Leclercia adecarboxylata]QIM43504.1 glycosyltransferase family 2 protein [Leclercia adecarboxylata]
MLHVLIPSKNNPSTLLTQIKILQEVFHSNNNIRIIVLDNSNIINQDVVDICQETDWIYDNNECQLSVSDNFNRGIEYVKSREGYSTFIGDDDFVTPSALKVCKKLESDNIKVFRPVFESLVYWKGFTSRRGAVTSDFEVRKNSRLVQTFHNFVKKFIFKDINKCDGPQFNMIPSFYHCIFSNSIVADFKFGPFAPDSYSAGFLQRQHVSSYSEISNAIIPGSAPKSSSAYTAVKDGFDSFASHGHTNAFLDNDTLEEIAALPYRSDYIWYLSFLAGEKQYLNAKQFTRSDLESLSQYNVSNILKKYKRFISLASTVTITVKKKQINDFTKFLKNG